VFEGGDLSRVLLCMQVTREEKRVSRVRSDCEMIEDRGRESSHGHGDWLHVLTPHQVAEKRWIDTIFGTEHEFDETSN
jgi:hypothetical protein